MKVPLYTKNQYNIFYKLLGGGINPYPYIKRFVIIKEKTDYGHLAKK